jgi:2-dehydro-3-deoxygluconokinase
MIVSGDKGRLDFLALGALVHRLDPGHIPFRKATRCDIHVSGGEFNVAVNLSDCFRLKTGIATAIVEYPIGDWSRSGCGRWGSSRSTDVLVTTA